jgi:ADP-heptose:LPS heptosyltransferase
MKTRTKIVIDRSMGTLICFVLNGIARLLGLILRRNHKEDPECVKKVVIQKFFGMGSILRATSMIRAIRKHYPKAEIIFVTITRNRCLLERLSNIDKVFYINDGSVWKLLTTTLRLLVRLWKEKIDLYFDLEVYSSYSTLIETLSCARNRYGFYRKSTGFRMGLHTKLVFFNTHHPISKVYAQLARSCGAEPTDLTIEKISIFAQDRIEFENWAKQHLGGRKYLAVNPNASDLLLERRWPAEYFADFINQFGNLVTNSISIVLLGAPAEREYVSGVYSQLSEKAKRITFNVAGELSLGAVFALIDSALLLITVDSGPYHFATSLNTPTLSLWGPVRPSHYSSEESAKMIIYKNIYCSPCLHHADKPPCKGNNVCMKLIQPFEVLALTLEFLGIDAPNERPRKYAANYNELGVIMQ